MIKNSFKLFHEKEKEKHNNKVFIFQTYREKNFSKTERRNTHKSKMTEPSEKV